jgi:hypothetical protein
MLSLVMAGLVPAIHVFVATDSRAESDPTGLDPAPEIRAWSHFRRRTGVRFAGNAQAAWMAGTSPAMTAHEGWGGRGPRNEHQKTE